MRYLWGWLVLRLPFVIHSRRGQWQAGKDAFDLGRDYERAVQSGVIK